MPRRDRIFIEGGVYHAYNRLARGERVFESMEEAVAFVELLREITQRDEFAVLAWCLMPNHYHLALRMGAVPLDRPMRSLQQRLAQRVNRRRKVRGPLWQGRYRAKLVASLKYLRHLFCYIHLNPVSANIVRDPADYRWSGHRELLGTGGCGLVAVDEALVQFGHTRSSAIESYLLRLKNTFKEKWIGGNPGELPWWKLGRPVAGDTEDLETAIREQREREEQGSLWRPELGVEFFLAAAAGLLEIDPDLLRSRKRDATCVRARDLLILLGVERYRLKVKDLARELNRSPDGMTKAIARAIMRRTHDESFRIDLNYLDRAIAEKEE